MNLNEYLRLTNGTYDEIIELIKYSRDIASGQTKYKNYLIDLKEFIDSNNKIFIGTSLISSLDELNEYFNNVFLDWPGLENEISNTVRILNNYENVEHKLISDSREVLPEIDLKSINFADYASHEKCCRVSWNGDGGYLLNVLPKRGSSYRINSAVIFNTAKIYYFLYQNATTEYNGIQNLSDLEDLRLCRCSVHDVQNLGKYYSIEVYVEEIFSFNDIITFQKLNYKTSDYWYQFLLTGQVCFEAFGDFLYASINIQSDIGSNYIFKRKNGLLYLLMIEEWGVGQPTFQYIVNYEINDTDLKGKITNHTTK
jgi:hypothetical protein